MHDRTPLFFFCRILEKMRINSNIVQHESAPAEMIDFGLRKHLGRESEYDESIRRVLEFIEENTVYRLTDPYCCKYIFMVLPETDGGTSLVIGPYISFEMTSERLMEESERAKFPASEFRNLEEFYRNLPVLPDDTQLMALVTALAEELWGSVHSYKILDLTEDSVLLNVPVPERASEENSLLQISLVEQRYAYENELMDKVSKGLWHHASMMLQSSVLGHIECRTTDPIRNQKNFCIICNTLLRKAAEKGGVHPIHLDKISTAFAKQIELIGCVKEGEELISQMAQGYCRLVRRHNIRDYSILIQKVITYIDAEISSNLTLTELARLHSVSPEYLSTLFHRETGKTLIQFINDKRLALGADLLRQSHLQVQTIAEYCGFPDAGYFAKLFKKRYGISPKTFREKKGGFWNE